MKNGSMSDKELNLKLLYFGHNEVELSLLGGALESDGIPFLVKRDVGMASQVPTVFFSPATETSLYVAQTDWVRAEGLAQLVLGDEWERPEQA